MKLHQHFGEGQSCTNILEMKRSHANIFGDETKLHQHFRDVAKMHQHLEMEMMRWNRDGKSCGKAILFGDGEVATKRSYLRMEEH